MREASNANKTTQLLKQHKICVNNGALFKLSGSDHKKVSHSVY